MPNYTPPGAKPTLRVEMNEYQRQVVRDLAGRVIGWPDAIKSMGKFQINPDNLPYDMAIERAFWRAFYKISRDRQVVDTGKDGRAVVISRADMEAALMLERQDSTGKPFPAEVVTAFLDKAESRRPQDNADPWSLAVALGDWFSNRRGALAAQEILDIFNDPIGDTQEKFDRAGAVWAEAQPASTTVEVVAGDEIPDYWLAVYDQRIERWKNGQAQGPVPHFLDEKVPPQREGELGALAAKSGMGKTTVLLDWAHDFAHEQGFDVLFVYMETLTESMFDRWVSRHAWVQVKDLVDPKRGFNLRGDKPGEKAAWAKFSAMAENYKKCQKEKGRIFFCYAPDISATEFEAQVAQYKAMSNAAGRGLVVIVDYYSLLGMSGLDVSAKAEDWRQNDARAAFFKRIAKRYRVFMWVAAQDNMNAKYTDNERKTPKNGSVIFEQAQFVVRIMRGYAKENLAMCNDKGVQRLDNAGRPIYWELKDQPTSLGNLMVEKVSDGETGAVHVKFNPAYYRIILNESRPEQKGEVA